MAEETIVETGTPETGTEQNYIQAINELKANTVSKELYDKLKNENKELLDALVEGKQIELPEQEKAPDVNELRKELYNPDNELSNLDYVSKTLQLRKAVMDAGGQDPFLPIGDRVTVTSEMIDQAQTVADVLQECVDFAKGDSGIFTAEVQRRTKDTMPIRRAK